MTAETCIFCKIIRKQIPTQVIAENDTILVIKDINPKAPIHYLIIPKKHIQDVQAMQQSDAYLFGDIALMAQHLSLQGGQAEPQAFRLVMNNGHAAGQRVFHMHMHYLSGPLQTEL